MEATRGTIVGSNEGHRLLLSPPSSPRWYVSLCFCYLQLKVSGLVVSLRTHPVCSMQRNGPLHSNQVLRDLIAWVWFPSYAVSCVLQVMLGASAVLSNGTVLSRAGSAAVAMTAHASSKPVLVCCEAFKVR